MVNEDHLLKMFIEVHGVFWGSCSAQVIYDDMSEPIGVACMKDGHMCWSEDIATITFNFLTKDWE